MLTFRQVLLSTLGLALLAPAVPAAPGDVTLNGAIATGAGFGGSVFKLAPVDLDGDGLLDLVSSGGSSTDLWRQLGNGTLTPLPDAEDGGFAVVVDLDGDGLLSVVSIHDGQGINAQEFGAPFVLGPSAQLVAPDDSGGLYKVFEGDLDGDGDVDILADGKTPDGGLRTWLGDGSGGLLPSIQASSALTVWTELGDLDLDGTLDLLAGLEAAVTPLLGQGDGTFVAQAPVAVGGGVKDVALGHLDGDGLLDAAVGCFPGPHLLLGTGGGGLQPWTSGSGNAGILDLGDADADGDDDVVSYSSSTHAVTVQLVGPAGLGATGSFVVQWFVPDVVLAPLHAGAPATVLAARSANAIREVAVVDCGPDGLPALEQQFASAPSSIPAALADVDGDGRDELVALQVLAQFNEQIVVHEIPGDGTIGPASAGTPFAVGSSLRPVFLDGDAFEDLLVTSGSPTSQHELWIPWLSNGDGTFTPGATIHQQLLTWVDTLGDIDGDGDDDLLVSASAGATWLANLGDGTFAPGVAVLLPGVPTPSTTASVALADADGDGLADLFTSTGFNPVVITRWKGAGDGSFGSPQVLSDGTQASAPLRVGDVDGDGHTDVLSHGSGVGTLSGGLLAVMYGHGDGSFDAPRFFPAAFLPTGQPPTAIDFDHEGRLDVVVQDIETSRWVLLPQAADGSFGEPRPLAFESIDRPLTADVDGDGVEDLLSYAPASTFAQPRPLRVGWVDVQPGALDLGYAHIGTTGTPLLTGGGLMQPTQAVHIDLAAAPASTPLLLVLGLQTGYQPLAGGTLVPEPQVVLGGIVSAPDGSFQLQARWPADAPAGLVAYVQGWCQDPLTGAAVASNALQFEGD